MQNQKSYLTHLLYFIGNNRLLFSLLIFLAISVGFIESLTITLMYPIISSSLGMNTNSIPYLQFLSWFDDWFPWVNPFERVVLLFIVSITLGLICQVVYWKFTYLFTKKIIVSVKEGIYEQVRINDFLFFEERKQGDVVNLLNAGPNHVTSSLEVLMAMIADCAITIMIILSLYFISDIGLLIVIVGGGIYYFINSIIGKTVSKQLGQLSYQSGLSENVVISEYISGMRAIRATNTMKHWEGMAMDAVFSYWDNYARGRFIQKLPMLLLYSLFLLSIGFIVLILSRIYQENFSLIIPIFGAFAIGTFRIIPKISNIGSQHLTLINNGTYVQSVYSFLQDTSYHSITDGCLSFEGIKSSIRFDKVFFSYDRMLVLNDLSLTLHPGKVTAIVGSSGAGKSTITNLLLRLYDPVGGKILLNEIDLRNYNIGSVRDCLGYVGQEPFVFNASIRDNITFGCEYSDTDVEYAARLAHAHRFIVNLPEGYDTIIGDRGMKLSGGEKQRVVIARAMIRRPELLILDEATSSLDNISEAIVQEAIDEVTKSCTTLVIAHRLTTIQKADWIYVLEHGRVVEEGKHEELIRKKGVYWGMYIKVMKDDNLN